MLCIVELIVGIMLGFFINKKINSDYPSIVEPDPRKPVSEIFMDDKGVCYRYHRLKISN